MQVANAGSARRICSAIALRVPQVSYLAQTQHFTPVILDSPECVDGAAEADS